MSIIKTGEKQYQIRCTTLLKFLQCPDMFVRMSDLAEEVIPPTRPMRLGTAIHHTLYAKMQEQELPDIDPDLRKDHNRLLFENADFVNLDLDRSRTVCYESHLELEPNFVITVEDNLQFPIKLGNNYTRERLLDYMSMAGASKYVETVFEDRETHSVIHFISKTRGYNSYIAAAPLNTPSNLNFVDNKHTGNIFYGIHPKMFGKELVHFEYPVNFDWDLEGYNFTIKGTMDCASLDFSLIADYKTSGRTPGDYNHWDYINYIQQQIIYMTIITRYLKIPAKLGYAVLFYLIKTKTPKAKVVAYKITEKYIDQADKLIKKACRALVRYLKKRELTWTCYGSHCKWCPHQKACNNTYPVMPEAVDVSELLMD